MVGGRSGCSDAEVRRANDRRTGGRKEQPLRGNHRYGQTESLARFNAVRSGGRAGYHDRGQLESLIYKHALPREEYTYTKEKKKKRINGYLTVELNAQNRELIVIRISVVLVDETYYTSFISTNVRDRSPFSLYVQNYSRLAYQNDISETRTIRCTRQYIK